MMNELADVMAAAGKSSVEQIAARKAFVKKRGEIWKDIQFGTPMFIGDPTLKLRP